MQRIKITTKVNLRALPKMHIKLKAALNGKQGHILPLLLPAGELEVMLIISEMPVGSGLCLCVREQGLHCRVNPLPTSLAQTEVISAGKHNHHQKSETAALRAQTQRSLERSFVPVLPGLSCSCSGRKRKNMQSCPCSQLSGLQNKWEFWISLLNFYQD